MLDNTNVLNVSPSQSRVTVSVQLRRGRPQEKTRVSVILPNKLLKSLYFLLFYFFELNYN